MKLLSAVLLLGTVSGFTCCPGPRLALPARPGNRLGEWQAPSDGVALWLW
jgi:hypothetical protein